MREALQKRRGRCVVNKEARYGKFGAGALNRDGRCRGECGQEAVALAAGSRRAAKLLSQFLRARVLGACAAAKWKVVYAGPVRERDFGLARASVMAERGAVKREAAACKAKRGVVWRRGGHLAGSALSVAYGASGAMVARERNGRR